MDARQTYTERLSSAKTSLADLDRRGAMLANLRTLTFLAFAGLGLAVVFEKLPRIALVGAVLSAIGFVMLAVIHARVIAEEARAQVRVDLNERGLARLNGQWRKFRSDGAALLPANHPYAGDLDVLGQGSLFQRLDETGTTDGEAQLAQWLLKPPTNAAEVIARQNALKELAPLIGFRQTLITEAKAAGKDKANPKNFIEWAEAGSVLGSIRWAFPLASIVTPVTVILGFVSAFGLMSPKAFYVGVLVQILIIALTRKPLAQMFEAISIGENGLVRFEETFAAIDAQTFSDPALKELRSGLQQTATSVSLRLKSLTRLLGFASLKASAQMHPFVNALTLWDIHVFFRIEKWRVQNGSGIRQWFRALAQLEALSSMATWGFENPAAIWPTVSDGAITFEAKKLGHPLLDHAVPNDVSLPSGGHALIITGSNMSGKTTLMRSMGLTSVMALAGLPVPAESMSLSVLQVMTSMRVKDSLERGVSYFYAEVQRIKTLLDTAKASQNRCMFLLDELFMGTNTRERQIASKHLVRTLLDHKAIGAITTHDLSLCELEAERPTMIRNVHFRDLMENGNMTFDYTLRNGIVTTSNALEVLRKAGVDVPDA